MPGKDNGLDKLVTFTDETRYLNMIRNRPSVSVVPRPNQRIIAQRTGTNLIAFLGLASILGGIIFNQTREMFSYNLYPTRKRFIFKSDPYSGTVSCTYHDAPYKQCGY